MQFGRIFLLLTLPSLLLCSGCRQKDVATTPVNSNKTEDFLSTVVFVGDSTTAHMQSRAKVEKEQVWATESRYMNLSPRVTAECFPLPLKVPRARPWQSCHLPALKSF